MGRPRIFINTSIYPDDVIETLARIFYDDLINDLNSEEKKLCCSPAAKTDSNKAEGLDIAN